MIGKIGLKPSKITQKMVVRLKILFWLQGLFWTNSTKSSPLVYILPLTNIFQRGYFVKFGGKLPLAPLYFEPCGENTKNKNNNQNKELFWSLTFHMRVKNKHNEGNMDNITWTFMALCIISWIIMYIKCTQNKY